jgi:hypothetical protein
MKRKSIKKGKQKKRRNKKYPGAKAQSMRDKEIKQKGYTPATNYLTSYNANIRGVSEQLSAIGSSLYQPTILNAMGDMRSQLLHFNSFKSLLPDFVKLSPVMESSRNAMLALTGLTNYDTITELSSSYKKLLPSWYNESIANPVHFRAPGYSKSFYNAENNIAKLVGENNLFAFTLQSSLAKATELSLYAEKSLSSFAWSEFGTRIGLSGVLKDNISKSFIDASLSYESLLKSFDDDPKSFIEIHPAISKLLPVEYYTSADFLESISSTKEEISAREEILKNDIQYENEVTLTEYLPRIDTGLLKMWQGAVEALNSNNSDRVRHFAVSIRELLTHLLQQLAPNQDIISWTQDPDDFHNSNPKRRTRLRFIYRHISGSSLNKFIELSIKTSLEFIDLFQEGTHGIESNFTENQLLALKANAETTLKFILQIEFSINR